MAGSAVASPERGMGTRKVALTREIWIERGDFMEEPPRKFFRLKPGGEVRLRNAFIVQCTDVIKNEQGEVSELHCTFDPETRSGMPGASRKVKGTIHWVSAEHGQAGRNPPVRPPFHRTQSAGRERPRLPGVSQPPFAGCDRKRDRGTAVAEGAQAISTSSSAPAISATTTSIRNRASRY